MTRPTIPSRGRTTGLVIASILALALAACGAASGPQLAGNPTSGDAAGLAYRSLSGAQPNPVDQAGSAQQQQANPPLYDVGRTDLLIIKTGTMSLQVTGIDAAVAAASTKIAAFGGYVSGSDRSGDGDDQVATVTYRIPAAQWDAALVALRAIGTKVLAEQTQTQDVTSDVLDLGARITNLRATEAALQGIMTKATKISDVLAVQQQLTDVRGQIEQLQTQKKHLEGQAAFSTLTVAYSLKPEAAVITSSQQFDPNGEVDRAAASLVAVLQAIATAGIWFAIVWLPILFVLAIVGLIAFVVIRFVRRRRGGPGPILPTPTPTPSEG